MADIEQISIYKFKNTVKTFENCVKVDKQGNPMVSLLKYETISQDSLEGKFWYSDGSGQEKNSQNIPWIAFMNEVLENKIDILYANSFPRGLFLYKIEIDNDPEFFAISFGLGGDVNINKNKILHDFGIKVAMNICNPDEIKSIQTAQHEAISIQSEKQILSGAGLSVFNIDYNDEFFKRIIGKTKAQYNYISSVAGGEKIQVKFDKTKPLTWENIANITKELNNLYNDKSYQETDFRSFDNWSFEKDSEMIDILNERLLESINNKLFDKISLCVPELLDIDRYNFKYDKESDIEYDELNILDFISSISRNAISLNMLQSKNIYVKDKLSDQTFSKWKVYQCIVAEINNNDDYYILYNGQWRRISTNFKETVTNYLSNHNICFDNLFLSEELPNDINIYEPDSKHNREENFNKTCVKQNNKLLLLDKANISISGEKRYETCDILTSDKQLIHVKKYQNGASSLSHLFVQAKFYSEALIIDLDAKKTINDFIDKSVLDETSTNYGKDPLQFKALIPKDQRLDESDFTVVLCVLTENNIQLSELPFMTLYEITKMHDYLARTQGFKVKFINRTVKMS